MQSAVEAAAMCCHRPAPGASPRCSGRCQSKMLCFPKRRQIARNDRAEGDDGDVERLPGRIRSFAVEPATQRANAHHQVQRRLGRGRTELRTCSGCPGQETSFAAHRWQLPRDHLEARAGQRSHPVVGGQARRSLRVGEASPVRHQSGDRRDSGVRARLRSARRAAPHPR